MKKIVSGYFSEDVMRYIDSLSVKGKEKVPNEARGVEALIEEKYSV